MKITDNIDNLPPLTHTRAAVAEFDRLEPALWAQIDVRETTNAEAEALLARIEALGEAVGVAFGLDTSDRNNPETCRQCVRPGPAVPSPGAELSFVRRMLLLEESSRVA